MAFVDDLARLHKGIYPKTSNRNFIDNLKGINSLSYLTSFYDAYLDSYEANLTDSFSFHELKTSIARTKDLFFIGDQVINSKKTKYMFIFEGSLQKQPELTVTVEAWRWILNKENDEYRFLKPWRRGEYISEKFCMKAEVAKNSYVVDAVRFGKLAENAKDVITGKSKELPDIDKCRELLHKEIELLNPEFIIPVGNNARKILGSDANPNVIPVVFPAGGIRQTPITKHNRVTHNSLVLINLR